MSKFLDFGLTDTINGVTSLLNTGLGIWQAHEDRKFNAEQAELNRQFQTEERLATQQFNLDMWNLNNEYNSPAAQMERARAAGINPAAMLGNNKPAQSSPVQSTPMSGSAATSSAGGSVGSALIGNASSMMNNIMASQVQRKQLKINEQSLSETVRRNSAEIAKWLTEQGVNEATEEQIRKSVEWIDLKNYTDVIESRARVMTMYNENIEMFARLAQDMAESDSRIAVNTADARHKTALADFQEQVTPHIVDQEEYAAKEAAIRYSFAQELGVPLNSSEFEFNYALLKKGQWFNYVDYILRYQTDAQLKPAERYVTKTYKGSGDGHLKFGKYKLGGIGGSFDYSTTDFHAPLVAPKQGILNPIYAPATESYIPYRR